MEEAVKSGLKEMNLTIDQVDYEVIEEGKSILNIVLKPYRIRMANKAEVRVEENKEPIDAKAELYIDSNKLHAYLTLTPPNGGEMINYEQVDNILKERNITYGILHENIQDTIDSPKFHERILIAEGDAPINGVDGQISYLFEINSSFKPKLIENDKVDFKELDMIKNVNKGEVLAEKILPTNGTDGKTIMGDIIKAKPGKPVYLKLGKNVIEDEEGMKLIANEDGCPKLIDGKVTVLQIYEINGNVDNSIGNIYFNGKIIVKGNVCTGFKIQCDGDIEVHGVVEGAEIIAEGDIILRKGIQGNNIGKLYSKKSITASYIENSYVCANGIIYSDVVLHSVLESKSKIQILGKKGMLVGGETRAVTEIRANSIGSPMSTKTKLEVGIDPEIKQRYESVKAELETLYKNKESVIKAIDLLSKISKTTKLPEEKQAILQKSIKTRAYLEDKIKTSNESLVQLEEFLKSLSMGKIHGKNTIYSGVQITIGNSSLYIRENIKHTTVLKEESEIKTTVYMNNTGE